MASDYSEAARMLSDTWLHALAGGAVAAIMATGSWQSRAAHFLVGTLMAAYAGPAMIELAEHHVALGPRVEAALVFLTGLSGMIIAGAVQGIWRRLRARSDALADRMVDRL